MDKVKALIYLNQCGDKKLESKAVEMMQRHCATQDYEPVFVFAENTDCTGISEPIKYMMIGMAAEMKIDVIITMFSGMVSMNEEKLMDVIGALDNYGVMVETVRDDMDEFYNKLFEVQPEEKCMEICDEQRFIHLMAEMWELANDTPASDTHR